MQDFAMTTSGPPLGLRVLIVEDEFLIGEAIALSVEGCGCRPVGPAMRVSEAMQLLDAEAIDCALLDVNLGDETSAPIAGVLRGKRIPFAVLSGYAKEAPVSNPYDGAPWLLKPLQDDALRSVLARFKATVR
ncbi:MAG TPA: response regulator [Alphaproteobacteria bacterium]